MTEQIDRAWVENFPITNGRSLALMMAAGDPMLDDIEALCHSWLRLERVVEAARALPWMKADPLWKHPSALEFRGEGAYGSGVFFTEEVSQLAAALRAALEEGK